MSESQSKMTHAPNEVSVRGVLWGAGSIVIGIFLVVLIGWLLWRWWGAPAATEANSGPNARALPQVAPPALESAPRQDRAQYEAEKNKLLESWGWVDQQRGIARIPIEEAMRVMASQSQSQSQSQSDKASDARREAR